MSRRRTLPILILAAIATWVLGLDPGLCHAEDAECQANATHHTDLSCQCSCHMAMLLPIAPAREPAPLVAGLAPSADPGAPSLAPARLDRPPRG